LYYPVWALNQKLKQDKAGAKLAQYAKPTFWPWTIAVVEQLTVSARALVERTRIEIAEQAIRNQHEEERRAGLKQKAAEQRAQEDALLATLGLHALAFCRRRFTLAEMSAAGCTLGSVWPDKGT